MINILQMHINVNKIYGHGNLVCKVYRPTSNFRSGICLCPVRIDRRVSMAPVTAKREKIEIEQNPVSRHFLERITA